MSRPRYDVLLFEPGAVFLDLIFTGLPRLPELGKEIFASGFQIEPGGIYNSSCALAKLGLNVALVAQTGTDWISRYLLKELEAVGVDTSYMNRVQGDARAVTVSMSFPQDRAFVSFVDRPAEHTFPEQLLDAEHCHTLLVACMPKDPELLRLLDLARERGVKVVIDPHLAWASMEDEAAKQALGHADLLLPNADEARYLSGQQQVEEALQALYTVAPTVIKDGGHGSLTLQDGKLLRVKGIDSEVVDTTGAGDCFNAGFLSGWVKGRPLEECLLRGNICGGLAVRQAGGAVGAPDQTTMDAMLKKLAG